MKIVVKTIIPPINYFIGIYTSTFRLYVQDRKHYHVLSSFFPITYKNSSHRIPSKSSFTLSAIAFLLLQMRVFYIDNVLCIVITLSRLQGIIVVVVFLKIHNNIYFCSMILLHWIFFLLLI